jgi:hypothetical protein
MSGVDRLQSPPRLFLGKRFEVFFHDPVKALQRSFDRVELFLAFHGHCEFPNPKHNIPKRFWLCQGEG